MEKFMSFIADIFNVSVENLSLSTKYESIPEWDSLMQLRIVAELEDAYGIEIPIDEIPNITILADFYKYVEPTGD